MATEDHTELPSGGSELENVENELYNDVNITATSITSEKNGEAFQTSLEDNAEEVIANVALEIEAKISTTMVERHEKVDELGDSNVDNDKKVEAVISSSNKETKKVVRKRKKNVEEVSAHSVSSPPKTVKKKGNDVSSLKIKEVPPRDKSTEENDKKEVTSDDKLESLGKAEDEVEKADDKDVKIGKKVEEPVKKAVKIAKKKIVAKAKGESSNAVSAPTSSPNVAAVEAACRSEEDAKQIVKDDEVNLASAAKDSIPAIEEKDAEGTKDKPTPVATEKHLKKDQSADKRSKKVDGMGLIFMCNGKTKKDCFKYNVFGLPESKKALVAKIYKGMRLFLFDFDLKLLYGIYKAASPGGYNIEPKAFNSKFPSQVRFTVLRDSIPLPEEKFKAAIKENYTRNKFDCQLSPEQVRKLCKLFQGAAAGSSMRPGALDEAVMRSSRAREPKRRHLRREAYPSPPPRIRHLSPPPPRARYLSPPRRGLPLQPLPRPLPASLQPPYAYERPGDEYYYRREHLSVLDLEMRPRGHLPIGYHDAYSLYREPVLHREPAAYPPSEPAAYPPSLPSAYGARLVREPRSPPRYLY